MFIKRVVHGSIMPHDMNEQLYSDLLREMFNPLPRGKPVNTHVICIDREPVPDYEMMPRVIDGRVPFDSLFKGPEGVPINPHVMHITPEPIPLYLMPEYLTRQNSH